MNKCRIATLFLLIVLSTINIHAMQSDPDGEMYFEEITYGVRIPVERDLATSRTSKPSEDYTAAHRRPIIPRESNFNKLRRLFSKFSISTNFAGRYPEKIKPEPRPSRVFNLRVQKKPRNQKSTEDSIRKEERIVNLLKAQRDAALIKAGALRLEKHNL